MKNLILPLVLVSSISFPAIAITAEDDNAKCNENSDYRTKNQCMALVMVVRHAEDGMDGNTHVLTAAGAAHAALYPKLFRDFVYNQSHTFGQGGASVCVCPIKKIISIDKDHNKWNSNPSPNPYNTISPLAKDLGITIQVAENPHDVSNTAFSSGYKWNTARRLTLLSKLSDGSDSKNFSTVIAWDKQGLNIPDTFPGEPSGAKEYAELQKFDISLAGTNYADYSPLLKALHLDDPSYTKFLKTFLPSREHFYVYGNQDKASGKFSFFHNYIQQLKGNSGWLVIGEAPLNNEELPFTDIRLSNP